MRLWLRDLGLNENPCSAMQRSLCSADTKMDDLAGKRRAPSQVKLQALIEILLDFLRVGLSPCRNPLPPHRIRL